MTTNPGLAEFLLQRIAGDEARAIAGLEQRKAEALAQARAFGVAYIEMGGPFDPSRVLAECEGKRRIVELHSGEASYCLWSQDPNYTHAAHADGMRRNGWPDICDTLAALAAPYSSHPDFDPSWGLG